MSYSPRRWSLWVLVALSISLAACPAKKPTYPTCDSDDDCQAGETCVAKKCVQCADDSQCGEGKECQNGACVDKAGWCNTTADCPNREACIENRCVPCENDGQCAAGSTCSEGQCLAPGQCTKNEDCADDEDCIDGVCKLAAASTPPAQSCTLSAVFFGFDESGLSPENRAILEKNGECLKSEEEREVFLTGHTDPRGTDEYNIALSDGRARAVGDYLARLGIDPARLHVVPKGEAEATGTDEAGWQQDRRVDIEWK